MFSPTLGRWIQNDPIEFEAGDPNLYRFVGNNPTNKVDPSGLQPPPNNGLGGKECKMPNLLLGLNRLFGGPNDKATSLKDVPYWRKDNISPLPPNAQKKTCGTDTGWSGVVPPGWTVGPNGCGPCVGVVLVPPNKGEKTFVCHFSPSADIHEGFKAVGFLDKEVVWVDKEFGGKFPVTFWLPPKGYKAFICGSEERDNKDDDQTRLHALEETTERLRRDGCKIKAYIPAPGFVVDENGQPYWITPGTMPVNKYEK